MTPLWSRTHPAFRMLSTPSNTHHVHLSMWCNPPSASEVKKVGLYLAASPSGSAATCGAALHCLPSAHSGQSGTSGRAGGAEVGSGHNLPAVSPHTCCRRKRIWTGLRWSRTRWCLWARCPLIPGHPSPGWSHINSLPAGRGRGQ